MAALNRQTNEQNRMNTRSIVQIQVARSIAIYCQVIKSHRHLKNSLDMLFYGRIQMNGTDSNLCMQRHLLVSSTPLKFFFWFVCTINGYFMWGASPLVKVLCSICSFLALFTEERFRHSSSNLFSRKNVSSQSRNCQLLQREGI